MKPQAESPKYPQRVILVAINNPIAFEEAIILREDDQNYYIQSSSDPKSKYTWKIGAVIHPLALKDLAVGDQFYAKPTKRRSSIGGTITKINRVNLDYDAVYEPRPGHSEILHLTTAKTELADARVKRGDKYFEVEE